MQANLEMAMQSVSLQQADNDFQFIQRNHQDSLKYLFTLSNKAISIINNQQPPQSIKNIPIVCSFADMDFKLCTKIQAQFIRLMSEKDICLGYTQISSFQRKMIISRVRKNVYNKINQQRLFVINSMLSLYYLIITQLTQIHDQVLIFTPTYYRFLMTVNYQSRTAVEYKLKTRQAQDGKQFYIDFQQLSRIFQKNNIKMIVWASPHNPSGRIWKRHQLKQLVQLVVKYKILIFSDDIFCQTVLGDQSQYISLLEFQQLNPYLIWATAFGKAFNCSGNSFTYGFIQNKKIHQTLIKGIDKAYLFPTIAELKLMQSCYTVGDEWRIKMIHHVMINYLVLKQQLSSRSIPIGLYTMQSSFLAVLDFSHFNLSSTQIKSKLQQMNIFPTYFDSCFVKHISEKISIVRFNLAMDRKILLQMIDRLQKVFNRNNIHEIK